MYSNTQHKIELPDDNNVLLITLNIYNSNT